MFHLNINAREISVPAGTTILTAARSCGFDIPTMCFADGYEPFTSCMICVVQEMKSLRLLPACSALAVEGMVIETDNEAVHDARRTALDLLLSEHIGDCEEPCKRICPAHLDISRMIRFIQENRWHEAIAIVRGQLPLAGVIGRICPTPCEKGCNRGHYDAPLAIRELERIAADTARNFSDSFYPEKKSVTGFRVAIIGAGPAGLTAAWYLQQFGHSCVVFDGQELPGGALRSSISEKVLPKDVLDFEISMIQSTGVEMHMNSIINNEHFKKIIKEFHAVVLTCGEVPTEICESMGIAFSPRGISVDTLTMQTNVEKIFAGGNAVASSRMAVKSTAHGKKIATSIDRYLMGKKGADQSKPFQSIMGRPSPESIKEFLQGMGESFRSEYAKPSVLSDAVMAAREAGRCFHCDCSKPHTCRLRIYSEAYQASQQKYRSKDKRVVRNYQHLKIVYEPGKCIKCGLCIQITQKKGERLGLTFIGRGFDVKIAVPFHESLENGLEKVAEQVVEYCPTAALSFKNGKNK